MKFKYFLIAPLIFFTGCSIFSPSPKESAQDIIVMESLGSDQEGYLDDYLNKMDGDGREHKNFGNFFSKYLNTKVGGDCSGFVSVVNKKQANMYFDEGKIGKYYDATGRKSKAIFNLYDSQNLIIYENPKIGDLIFFANTIGRGVQKNSDMKNITHIGIVTDVAQDETVRFIHFYKGKIQSSFMNLSRKNIFKEGSRELNSYLVRCKKNKTSCLASNRFAGYGKVK